MWVSISTMAPILCVKFFAQICGSAVKLLQSFHHYPAQSNTPNSYQRISCMSLGVLGQLAAKTLMRTSAKCI